MKSDVKVVEYVVMDCPIMGKVIVRRYLQIGNKEQVFNSWSQKFRGL